MNRIVVVGLGLGCLGLSWVFWRSFREPGASPLWSEDDEQGWPVLRWLRWLAGFLLAGTMAATGLLLVASALFSDEV